ncbi:MAG: DUF5723 family protein [Flavobacteriales bacterium]
MSEKVRSGIRGSWQAGVLIVPLVFRSLIGGAQVSEATIDTLPRIASQEEVVVPHVYRSAPGHAEKNRLQVEASGLYDSNALRNDLVSGMRRGDVLSEDLRRTTQDELKGNNRAGYALDFRVSYAWGDSLFGDGSIRPTVSIGHHDAMGVRFADDLYDLTFFGNTQFENKTASLGGTAFTQITYQTFGFGFQGTTTNSFLRLELVNGQRMNSATLRKADLFTATDGRFLQLDLDGSYARSDTASSSFGTSSGLGLALSAAVEKPIMLFGTKGSFRISVTDLGFVAWNGNAQRIVNNSTIRYEGIEVDNIFDLDGVVLNQAELQDTIGLSYSTGAFSQLLPTKLEARIRTNRRTSGAYVYPNTYIWELVIDQRNLPGYAPLIMLTRSFWSERQLKAEVSLSHGGFGGTRVGIGAMWLASPSFIVGLRIPNIIGPLSGSGHGAAVLLGIDVAL